MSKQVKILVVLVIAALAVYFIYTSKPWRSFKGDETDFAIEDTAAVTRVFMANGRGSNTLLERQADGSWTVDGKFPADPVKVNLLLQTIHDVKLRNPVGQGEFNNVLKSFTAAGVKVEFYEKDKLIKTVYVGQMTSDQTGTYMMMEGASAPYVTHIPGFVGYLTPRFLTESIKWRSRIVFNVKPDDIAAVSVTYPAEPSQSFRVENTPSGLLLKDANGTPVAADSVFLKYYTASFEGLFGESFDELYQRAGQDSISKTAPYCVVKLETREGKQTTLQVHVKKLERGTKERFDDKGNLLVYDTERYAAFVNDSPDMMYVQQFNFGRVLRKLDDFRGKR